MKIRYYKNRPYELLHACAGVSHVLPLKDVGGGCDENGDALPPKLVPSGESPIRVASSALTIPCRRAKIEARLAAIKEVVGRGAKRCMTQRSYSFKVPRPDGGYAFAYRF